MSTFIPTEEQEKILSHRADHHARLLAGPGTGKSATLIALVDRLLANQPDLALRLITFTRAASAELRKKVVAFCRSDDYFLGVLQARPHELWTLRRGGRMGVGNDPVYTPTTTFETFPFPWPPGREPSDDLRVLAIAEAARELVEKRNRWLNPEGATEAELKKRTLTNLYNQRPMWLDLAHKKLDAAASGAYSWPHDLGDEEVLERLLALNLERAKR